MWILIAVSAYFILAIVYLADRYLLVGPIPDPKIYSFYIGLLGSAALLLIPFIDFYILDPKYLFFSFIAGATFILGILWSFRGFKSYGPSRIVPAVGGILPILTFLIIFIFSAGKENFNSGDILPFSLLILGSVLITYEKDKAISGKSLQVSFVSALFFAFSLVFSKYVYLEHQFLTGLIWIKIGGALMALFLLFSHKLRNDLFRQKIGFQKNTIAIFFSVQAMGAGGGILQNWAVALAPMAQVVFVNALQGVQYVFLLMCTILLSYRFPKILKEKPPKGKVLQKIIATLLIGGGLAVLALEEII